MARKMDRTRWVFEMVCTRVDWHRSLACSSHFRSIGNHHHRNVETSNTAIIFHRIESGTNGGTRRKKRGGHDSTMSQAHEAGKSKECKKLIDHNTSRLLFVAALSWWTRIWRYGKVYEVLKERRRASRRKRDALRVQDQSTQWDLQI